MLKRFEPSQMIYYPVTEGEKTSCLIPTEGVNKLTVEVRCEREVDLNVVTEDGQTIPLAHGRIVRWSGKLSGSSAVEIVGDAGFWYQCRKSSRWLEIADPTPMVIELKQTEGDILRSMIDERLQKWKVQQELNRELTEDEKDELILDIANGDLEFEDIPDAFGLGYEERLDEYYKREQERLNAEQEDAVTASGAPSGAPAPAVPAGSQDAPVPPAAGANSSST